MTARLPCGFLVAVAVVLGLNRAVLPSRADDRVGVATAAENLLRNAGFEDGLTAWEKRTPEDANRTLAAAPGAARSGKLGAMIENRQATLTRLRQGHDKSLTIAPGALVECTAWVRSELTPGGLATVRFFCMGDDNKILLDSGKAGPPGPFDWQRLRLLARVPDGTRYCMVYVEASRGTGVVSFDDVGLRVCAPPAVPQPAPRIAVLTDLPEDHATLRELAVLLGDGLVPCRAPGHVPRLAEHAGCLVLFQGSDLPDWVRQAVAASERDGIPVVMDIRAFAELHRLEQPVPVGTASAGNRAAWVFNREPGTYDIVVTYADEHDGAGRIQLLVNDTTVSAWTLDETPAAARVDVARDKTVAGVALRPGDTISFVLTADSGEACRVDKLVLCPADGAGAPVPVEAEAMELGANLAVEAPALMFESGVKVARRSTPTDAMQCGLRVESADPAVRGFRPGQVIPWHSDDACLQCLAPESRPEGMTAVATGPNGAPALVRLGSVVAVDILSLGEPRHRNVGAYYKYLVVANVLTNPVAFGEYYEARYRYVEFVNLMRQAASTLPGVELRDEGPDAANTRLYSLNLGKPGAPLYFLYAACHGSEWEPAYGLLTFAKLLAQGRFADTVDLSRVSVKILPILNPSGYDAFTRKNANGVDVNRQGDESWAEFSSPGPKGEPYGPASQHWKGTAPFAEPEAAAYRRIADLPNLYCVLDFHGNTSAVNNKLGILPATGREGNDLLAFQLQDLINRRLRNRFILRQADEESVSAYIIDKMYSDSLRPTLINTSCRGRYGVLFEITCGYPSSYGTVLQTDVTCEICRALFDVYRCP